MRAMFTALALIATAASAQSGDGTYALSLAVTPAPGAPLQRIDLPAEALAALRSPSRADVRIIDRDGTALPMAITAPSGGTALVSTRRLEALPILGPAGSLRAGETELRVERRDRVVVVIKAAEGDAKPVGALFDTRAIDAKGRNLRLDALLPPQQPVTIIVESSRDLAGWSPVAEKILYRRSAGAAGGIGPEAIPLGDIDLKGRYLRVSWTSPQKLLGPVEIGGATIELASPIGRDDRPAIATGAPRKVAPHDIRFSLSHAALLSAVAIAPAAGEMLVPVRLLARNAPDQPWVALGSGTVRGAAGATIELSGAAYSDYRIEADARTPGFAAPPKLRLLFEPARLLVLFDGKPPYRLTVGDSQAESRYLAPGQMLPGYRPGAEARLPAATVMASSAAPVLALAESEDRMVTPRKTLLWGLLLLGVAALGWMVWRLWKPGKS